MIYATGVEWISGHLIELIWKERWWDYRNIKWNIGGYVCLPMSILWGVLGFLVVSFVNPFLLTVYSDLPSLIVTVFLWIVLAGLAIDITADLILIVNHKAKRNIEKWENANHTFSEISIQLSSGITGFVEKRIKKAYPNASKIERKKENNGIFAYGICFDKIV